MVGMSAPFRRPGAVHRIAQVGEVPEVVVVAGSPAEPEPPAAPSRRLLSRYRVGSGPVAVRSLVVRRDVTGAVDSVHRSGRLVGGTGVGACLDLRRCGAPIIASRARRAAGVTGLDG